MDFIPIDLYTPIFYGVLLFFVLFTALHTQVVSIDNSLNLKYIQTTQIALLFFLLLYIGLRPIHGIFVDMTTYAKRFSSYQSSTHFSPEYDFLFYGLMFLAAKVMSAKTFFLICAILYVVPLFSACKKLFRQYSFYAFLMLVISFEFWAYGTNGIRNGIATSVFLFAVSRDNKFNKILWLLIAISLHKSMLIPSLAFLATRLSNSPKLYLKFWILCIPISLIAGHVVELFFTNLGFVDDRLGMYLTDQDFDTNINKGFRWDFLFYSATGVAAGWYTIFKKRFFDNTYFTIFNIYLITNGFWILVITANFSNRFAYLSWFLLGILIIYPFLKEQIFKHQHQKIGLILLGYFGFTFIMNVILK